MDVAMSDNGTIQFSIYGLFYKSTDSGASFDLVSLPQEIDLICTNSDASIIFGTDILSEEVYISKNGGDTFVTVLTGILAVGCAMSGDGMRMILVTGSAAYMSTDFGSNWSQL
eukprot:347217-Chlamydomonas_euryale.AAC.1